MRQPRYHSTDDPSRHPPPHSSRLSPRLISRTRRRLLHHPRLILSSFLTLTLTFILLSTLRLFLFTLALTPSLELTPCRQRSGRTSSAPFHLAILLSTCLAHQAMSNHHLPQNPLPISTNATLRLTVART